MAKVNKTALHDFTTGEYVLEQHLDQNFEVLRVALNDADDRVTNLASSTGATDTSLQAQINQNKTDITNLSTSKADKTYVDQQDSALQAQITENRTDIDTQAADIAGLNSAITNLHNITADKVDKVYVDAQDANLQADIDDLDTRVTNLEMADFDTRITALETTTAGHTTSIAAKADKTYVDQQIANVQAGQIGDSTINTEKIIDGAITTSKIAAGAVTADKVDGVTVLTAAQVQAQISGVQDQINALGYADVGAAPAVHGHDWGAITGKPTEFTPAAHSHDKLTIPDTRDVNSPPSYYTKQVTNEFKNRITVGAPGSGTYCVVTTIAPWNDTSGGQLTQIAYTDDGGIHVRKSTSISAWGSWVTMVRPDKLNTFTQRQTFAAGITDGDSNTDVSLIKSLQHQTHTRSTHLTYTNGKLTQVEEKNGATVVKTTTLGYSGDTLQTVTETAGGVTVTQTLVYDGNGNLIRVDRA